MNEQKIEIENSPDMLFECYICQQKFDQYALEVHFVTAHSSAFPTFSYYDGNQG